MYCQLIFIWKQFADILPPPPLTAVWSPVCMRNVPDVGPVDVYCPPSPLLMADHTTPAAVFAPFDVSTFCDVQAVKLPAGYDAVVSTDGMNVY